MPGRSPYGSSKKPKPKRAPASSAPVNKEPTATEKTAGYQREFRHPSGREWNRKKAVVIDHYKGICHLCDHPMAQQIDHVIIYGETQDDSIANLRPAHGSSGSQKNPCPVCKLNCNQIRSGLSVEAGRRKIAKRIAQQGLTPPVNGEDNGRDW